MARPLHHPSIESITVAGLLHALADPTRLAIVGQLRCAAAGHNCVETMNRAELDLPKSTCSLHFQILREAGLIHSERKGVELTSWLRSEELDGRFPGLLDAILSAYKKEQAQQARRKKAKA